MAHPFEGIEREIAGMGEGMIPDMMSFFYDLPEQFFIAFYLVSDAKKSRLVCVFLLTLSALLGVCIGSGPSSKVMAMIFSFGFFTAEDTHVNTGTDAVRSVKEKGHDAYYDDYRN